MELEVERLYFDDEPTRVNWDEIGQIFTNESIIDEYIDETLKRVDVEAIRARKLKVVVDCGSVSGHGYAYNFECIVLNRRGFLPFNDSAIRIIFYLLKNVFIYGRTF